MLRTALGPAIARLLEDPSVVEVMLNPDGRLWINRLSEGLSDTGERLSAADGERIVRLVAHHVGVEVHTGAPRVSAELPETGERFGGLLPPVVSAPAFAIRKPAVAVFTLEDYVAAGIMAEGQAEALRVGVATRANILVAGGTSTGKTTLTNALLAEVAKTEDRVVIIEDTRELQCTAPNLVAMRTKDGVASLSELVRSSLRLRPDRIPIGEVRGSEALDLLKAWGTGHVLRRPYQALRLVVAIARSVCHNRCFQFAPRRRAKLFENLSGGGANVVHQEGPKDSVGIWKNFSGDHAGVAGPCHRSSIARRIRCDAVIGQDCRAADACKRKSCAQLVRRQERPQFG